MTVVTLPRCHWVGTGHRASNSAWTSAGSRGREGGPFGLAGVVQIGAGGIAPPDSAAGLITYETAPICRPTSRLAAGENCDGSDGWRWVEVMELRNLQSTAGKKRELVML